MRPARIEPATFITAALNADEEALFTQRRRVALAPPSVPPPPPAREALAERFGENIVASVEANLHGEVFQFLGKLQPTVYVLRKG